MPRSLGRKALHFVVILLPFQLLAQIKEVTLQGYLGVEGGESYTYKLVFSDSSGYIKGFAYTWLQEQKQVKASIIGKIDRANKILSFKETSILTNSGFESNTTICLIQAELKYKRDNDKMVFTGSITSSDVTNVYCGQGTITFQDNEALKELWSEAVQEPSVPKPVFQAGRTKRPITIVYDTASKRPQRQQPAFYQEEEKVKISSGEERIIAWDNDTAVIRIWDGGEIDGDVISLKVNDLPLLSKYTLQKESKVLVVAFHESEMTITIIAGNEGNTPPNTANISLMDGGKEYALVAYNTIGKQATIKLKKKGKVK